MLCKFIEIVFGSSIFLVICFRLLIFVQAWLFDFVFRLYYVCVNLFEVVRCLPIFPMFWVFIGVCQFVCGCLTLWSMIKVFCVVLVCFTMFW